MVESCFKSVAESHFHSVSLMFFAPCHCRVLCYKGVKSTRWTGGSVMGFGDDMGLDVRFAMP